MFIRIACALLKGGGSAAVILMAEERLTGRTGDGLSHHRLLCELGLR